MFVLNDKQKLIAIGASTGGTEALRFFLSNIPSNAPGIVITQHMPTGFTKSFADHLNTICEVTVKEASDGELILRGCAYIAPGGKHMEVYRSMRLTTSLHCTTCQNGLHLSFKEAPLYIAPGRFDMTRRRDHCNCPLALESLNIFVSVNNLQ